MPKNEKFPKEQKEKDIKVKNTTKKVSTNAKKVEKNQKVPKTPKTNKNMPVKKDDVKKVSEKKTPIEKNVEKKLDKIDEETVIDKIKNFLAKIALMQEESNKENDEKKAKKSVQEKKNNIEKIEKPKYMLEYYDLPYRYNETVVKVLAQTPKKLFVYWDVSDSDREKYLKAFGNDFFNKTYPVLLLYNEDKKYVREIAVNDFANSWYIDIQDPKTKYTIQLGRKFRSKPEIINLVEFEQNNIVLQTDYLPFANSNEMEAPNDHVLFESLPRFFTFRNVKTNEEITKDLRSFKDTFGNNYSVEEFYQDQYNEELSEGMFDMSNPSSGFSSSSFK